MSAVDPQQAKATPAVQAEVLLSGILAAAKAALPQGLDVLVWGAARLGDQATLRYLLANGGGTSWTYPMDGEDPWRGSSCLWAASLCGHEGAVKELLESGVDVDEPNTPAGSSPTLYIAARHGHEGVVEQLVKAGADVNKAESTVGSTPLYTAAAHGHMGVVEQLVKAGVDVDKARTSDGCTPLHIAANNGQKGVVELLLKAGANPNAGMHDGRTPLSLATSMDHSRVCSILLKAGANVDHDVAVQNRTALKIAMTRGSREAALVLMEHGGSCGSAILTPEELEQLTHWSTEALKEKERQMEEKDAQMERLVQGIPEWCAQAASTQASSEGQRQGGNYRTTGPLQPSPGSYLGISSKHKESAASLPGLLKWINHALIFIIHKIWR